MPQQNNKPNTIDDFIYSLISGVSRTNRFKVVINCTKFLDLPYFNLNAIQQNILENRITLHCEGAELPGSSFATSDIRFYGPTIQYPYDTLYPEVLLSFIVGADMLEKNFFDAWNYSIQDPVNNNLNYKNTYTTDIVIHQLDQQNNTKYQITLINAFPLAINPMQLSYSEKDQYGKLSVRFSYDKWINNDFAIQYKNEATVKGKEPLIAFNDTIITPK